MRTLLRTLLISLLLTAVIIVPMFLLVNRHETRKLEQCAGLGGHQYRLARDVLCLTPDGRIIE